MDEWWWLVDEDDEIGGGGGQSTKSVEAVAGRHRHQNRWKWLLVGEEKRRGFRFFFNCGLIIVF